MGKVMFPLKTTLNNIWNHYPFDEGKARILASIGKAVPDNEPITYLHIIETFGFYDALLCCHAEPQYQNLWGTYAIWCARRVQHLMLDPCSIDALDIAGRYISGKATGEELTAAKRAMNPLQPGDKASAAAVASVSPVPWALEAVGWAVSWAARAAGDKTFIAAFPAEGSAGFSQRNAFIQLVALGTLPAQGVNA